jgi:hypothetical protein
MKLIIFLLFIVLLIPAVLLGTLIRNDAPLLEPPGLKQRLQIYFTTNIAKTSDTPVLPELKTPVYEMSADRLFGKVIEAATRLRWSIADHDHDNQHVEFTIRSPVFLFEDDMSVQVESINPRQSALHIESRSRMGRGDLAANASHIQRLLREIK